MATASAAERHVLIATHARRRVARARVAALAAGAAAARAGVAVVRSSRTGGGVVERNIEIDDDALGLIAADELNPQKARVLLMLGLTRPRDPAALQQLFYTY